MKIRIIGGPGSGKSYATKKLSHSLKIPYYDLDDLYWDRKANRYGVKTPQKIRDKELKTIIKRKNWIIEGVYYDWTYESFSKADVIIVLKSGVYTRARRILRRFILRKLGLVKTKKECLKDFIKLFQWNRTFDNDWLIKAENSIKKFKRKTKYFNKADDAIDYILKFKRG